MAAEGLNQPEWCESSNEYLEDDIARALRASLVAVLSAKLASKEMTFDFIKGVLSYARHQAGLFGISWPELMISLCDNPELLRMIPELQMGSEQECCYVSLQRNDKVI